MPLSRFPLACATALALCGTPAFAQLPPGDGPTVVATTTLEPTPLKFDDALLRQLRLPPGFKVSVFAKDLQHARWMQVAPSGDVYLSRPRQGDVLLLRANPGEGRMPSRQTVAQNLRNVHGLQLLEGKLYMATDKKLLAADVQADGTLGAPRILFDDLPDGSQHPYRTMAAGPGGELYLAVGSQCNNCVETNPEAATVLRVRTDTGARTVFARGLRNTLGMAFNPVTQVLYGFDHGSDDRGDDTPPEELNAIVTNKHYGWPFCWGDRQVDLKQPNEPEGSTRAEFCPTTEPPVLRYTAHAAPIGFVFYTASQFPAKYRNGAFAAMRGSWNRGQPSGYRVVFVAFDAAGKAQSIEDFATGWLMPEPPAHLQAPGNGPAPEQAKARRPAQFGRIAGLAVAPDGSLLISEDQNGVIYRVSYGQ